MTATRKRKVSRKVKAPPRKPIEWRRHLRFMLVVISVPAIAYAALFVYQEVAERMQLPITEVIVDAPSKQLDSDAIKQAVAPAIADGFLSVDVHEVQQRVLEVPWIAVASVRRIWPGTLVIRVEQHRPKIRWGATKLISLKGVLYEPPDMLDYMHFARLNGDDTYHTLVYQKYQELGKRFKLYGEIESLSRSSRGGWSMILDSGLAIVLGSSEVDARVDRTLRFMRHFSDQLASLSRIDARYSNGVAVELDLQDYEQNISEETTS
ncbi:cell division protein FtsQ/DivIB [Solemya elarraichensis gill symbiont]|uniref:Cell division protein FtsQ n=1 Tax=Solemya elarraichensis gill symbiont TaxID=1918949 RepID=A0A1T2LD85_9GAMM|nr:FtsQ-type POTRA domain-containing protein [Solemya elarraichensis gill symbiont]OOZ43068.1 hypothetical protein BOW52_00445 [Solemya elarraichensis gill symbiont]